MTDPAHSQGVAHWVPTRDGRRLFAQVLPGPESASEAPTVVFEAGAAASRSSWAAVQQRVASFARAIVYDRSGLGRSAPDPVGRTIDRMADDLADLLDFFGPGPFVLVGHSGGGPIVRLAASRRLPMVTGLVLVEPVDEAAEVLFSTQFRRNERIFPKVMTALVRMGVARHLFRSVLTSAPTDDVRADLRREAFTVGVFQTHAQQARTFLDELQAWGIAAPSTGDVPVTVISGALARISDGIPKDARAQANSSHALRAAQSPHGRHVIAQHSGHTVPLTEPQLVADEIERLTSGVWRN